MYPCEKCLKLYKSKSGLKKHTKNCTQYLCEHCNKNFKHSTSYYRHRKGCSKNPDNRKKEEPDYKELYFQKVLEENRQLKDDKKKMEDLLEKSIENGGNITNNINNDHSQKVQINLTAFGREKQLDISKEEWCKLAYNKNILSELFRIKHIEDVNNRNFYIKDLKRSEVHYYENNKWETKKKKDALVELFFNQIQEIDDARSKYDFTTTRSNDRYVTIDNRLMVLTDNLCNNQEEEEKKLELTVFNHRNLIKEVYDKTNVK